MFASSEYLNSNLELVAQLLGKKIQSLSRLTYLKSQTDLRTELGSVLLETSNNFRLYIDVDEGMANILLFNSSDIQQPIHQKIDEFTYKYLIWSAREGQETILSILAQPISNIEFISRQNEDYDFSSMCGFKLYFPDGQSLCIGTHLTADKIPGVWILMPEEVDSNLHYQEVKAKSE